MSRPPKEALPGAGARDLQLFFTRPCNVASLLAFAPAGLAWALTQRGYLPPLFPSGQRLGMEDALHRLAEHFGCWADGMPDAAEGVARGLADLERYRRANAWRLSPGLLHRDEWSDDRLLPSLNPTTGMGYAWNEYGFPVPVKGPTQHVGPAISKYRPGAAPPRPPGGAKAAAEGGGGPRAAASAPARIVPFPATRRGAPPPEEGGAA